MSEGEDKSKSKMIIIQYQPSYSTLNSWNKTEARIS